jgi:hypothetical protein
MIAAWMVYVFLWAAWAAAAGWVIERALLRGRAPVRGIWIGAIALSLAAPVLQYRFAHRPSPAAPPAVGGEMIRVSGTTSSGHITSTSVAAAGRRMAVVEQAAARADGPLAVAWAWRLRSPALSAPRLALRRSGWR